LSSKSSSRYSWASLPKRLEARPLAEGPAGREEYVREQVVSEGGEHAEGRVREGKEREKEGGWGRGGHRLTP
jgi:hypothetical protein